MTRFARNCLRAFLVYIAVMFALMAWGEAQLIGKWL